MRNLIIFTVAAEDSVLGWEIETDLHDIPTPKKAIDRLKAMIGTPGIETFVNGAIGEVKNIEIIIANEFGDENSLEYDPSAAPEEEQEGDTPLSIFAFVLGTCLEQFLFKVKFGEEDIN